MAIGIAIIGGGIFAKEAHLPAIKAASSVKLLAVYSRSLKSAKNVGEGENVDLYSDDSGSGKGYDDLLKRDDIKAVVIALPIPSQPDYIRAALKAGKHVLSEKPIAKDVSTAESLVSWYHSEIDTSAVTWSVAENYRFWSTITRGAELTKDLGRLLGFQVRLHKFTKPDGKYYLTPWRTVPEYQGGFLLDGGVHYIAALRWLLGDDEQNQAVRVSAFTSKLQEHLPPIDTLNATVRTKGGVAGTVSVSFGTTFNDETFALAFEKGSISINGNKVIRVEGREGEPQISEVTHTSGVPEEIVAWAQQLASGKKEEKLTPEAALADLKLLEAIFKSGESDGAPVDV